MPGDLEPREKRRQQIIYILPSITRDIDAVRGKVSRSEWIEMAIMDKLREKPPDLPARRQFRDKS
jgi:hypothetical protein